MFPLWVLVHCTLLLRFVASTPADVNLLTEIGALQRQFGDSEDESNFHHYLRTVEEMCVSAGRSTSLCLSCEDLIGSTNALTCCRSETVYAQCRPIVELNIANHQRDSKTVFTQRFTRSYLGKRYRNRFLGKRMAGDEAQEARIFGEGEEDGFDRTEDHGKALDFESQKRARMTVTSGRRPNNFLGKRVIPSYKRRNTFLGKREDGLFGRMGLDFVKDENRKEGVLAPAARYDGWNEGTDWRRKMTTN